MKPLLLDLFCGAGGAGMGYHLAGFEVIGVDIKHQPRYPFAFIQADALEFLASAKLQGFDLIHASPPCQAYSVANNIHQREHPRLIEPLRALLVAAGKPYVIENVIGAPLLNPVMLCGMMFGLKVFRHRLFETDPAILVMPHARHGREQIGVNGFCCVAGHGDSGRGRIAADHRHIARWKVAMGIDWMTRDELAQAIPPAYTQWIGEQLLAR